MMPALLHSPSVLIRACGAGSSTIAPFPTDTKPAIALLTTISKHCHWTSFRTPDRTTGHHDALYVPVNLDTLQSHHEDAGNGRNRFRWIGLGSPTPGARPQTYASSGEQTPSLICCAITHGLLSMLLAT